MRKLALFIFSYLILLPIFSQELANYSFDNIASVTNWIGVADATGADGSGTNPLASLDFNAAGNETGALEISGVSDGPGKAFIFELFLASFNYQGAESISISFDAKFVGSFSNSAFHLLTLTPGAGTTNFLDLHGQVNSSDWSNLSVNINGITNANTTLKISFQIAAGAIVDAGGTVLIDNIIIKGTPASCSDGIQNGDEEGIDCGGSLCAPCNSDPVFDNLVWSDEFNGNGAINSAKWFHQTQLPAGGSWYNGEIQHYTNRIDNAFVRDGSLKIVAKKETYNDQGYTKNHTSARLNTKFAFTYGRVEVRAKLPSGVGTWPAIWMLGKNINEDGAYWDNQGFGTTNWPACGEIDIMEHWGSNQNYVQSAMHTPSSFGGTINHGGQTVPTASSQYHIYTLDWTEDKMVFRVDGVEHYTYNPPTKDSNTWPFDADQYLLLNIAIQPSIDPTFIQSSMEVDYVRVYQESSLSVSTQDKEEESIKVFPNPSQSKWNVYSKDSDILSMQLFDLLGKKVLSIKPAGREITIEGSDLESGLYFLRIKTRSRFKIIKLIRK